jgi:hypothetical protein
MPGIKRRTTYRKGITSREDIKALMGREPPLSTDVWIFLEKVLGSTLTSKQKNAVGKMAAFVKVMTNQDKEAITMAELIKKIRSLQRAVLSHREDIWHVENQQLLQTPMPLRKVDFVFFMRRSYIADEDTSPLELLAWAMDALVSTCVSVEKEMRESNSGTKDRYWFSYAGAWLRLAFESWELPHAIRKDVDKMKCADDSSGSKFLDFYIELLKRIGCPWLLSTSALATAISRVGTSESFRARVDKHIIKLRK